MVDRCISSHYSSANYPSFSSTLLDAIYRSIDDSGETETLSDHNRSEPPMKSNQNKLSVSENCIFKQEIVGNYQRACMIEKWMEKTKIDRESRKPTSDLKAKASSRKLRDEKLSSNSSSSTSSSDHHQYYFSCSEPESFHVLNPKPVRTGCSGFDKVERIFVTNYREIWRPRLGEGSEQIPKQEGDGVFLKTKSRALKIYGDLKKVKQPISPGAKITGFLNLLFSYKNPKKMRTKGSAEIACPNNESPSVKSTKTSSTTCSSASSFSRSCLSKTPSSARKSSNDSAVTGSVRFSSASIVTEEDYKSHGHNKALDQDDRDNYCKKTSDVGEFSSKDDYIGSVELMAARVMEKNHPFDRRDSDEDDDDDDAASYESSDLFELDNLSSIGLMETSYGDDDELPVYETTRLQM